MKNQTDIPVLHTEGDNIPEVWENSIVKLYNYGLWYNRTGRKDKDQLQLDSTMTMVIKDPSSSLKVHNYLSCGWGDLFEYQMELLGAKDSWVDKSGKSSRWSYHYHERLTDYPSESGIKTDQIEEIIKKLKEKPATRQATAITWIPEKDNKSDDPPCLQRIWFSLIPNGNNYDDVTLNMNYNFRSRNVMIAAPMNQFGLVTLQIYMRDRLSEETGKNISLGRIVDFVDSYHVSARDQSTLEGFIERLTESKKKGETINDRIIPQEIVIEHIGSLKDSINEKVINQTGQHLSGENLESEIKKIKRISDQVWAIDQRYMQDSKENA
jgi:thymidylate synthase